ncbi:protein-L-isoaspartate O-methyltransferase [Roseiarcaceae bacterium H3SJ34-1]|uniref:protein-L-isoaspartate O-methyltransferase family protein n=1 Tax=Terripilifer ovatus TaxID=3032367 RepID=UPI003AB96EBC|nr:protein-L-isoaspartate O-methyltransferase [Roseiarcaceae bacterium H3SJ34-1]
MDRRDFLVGATASLASFPAFADVPKSFRPGLWPPLDERNAFVAWMQANRGEDPLYLGQRFERYQELLSLQDLWTRAERRAFLLTPREEFVRPIDRDQAYAGHYLDIGFGMSITPPGTMGRMTSAIAIRPGDKVLEIGTGSGYQSALLSYLTQKLWSIEIVPGLASRTRALYDRLIEQGYREYAAIATRTGDGYYGWESEAPFDKIIATCGIDHIPPPLLQQLKPNGIMVIPVGPPGAQHILKVVKKTGEDHAIRVERSDIFGGKIIPFVPLSGGHQDEG